MITQHLPQIAAEVSAPLAKIEDILIIGGNKGDKKYTAINKTEIDLKWIYVYIF